MEQHDDDLTRRFAALRAADDGSTPSFADMLARARQSEVTRPTPVRKHISRRTWVLAVGGPLAVAAGLAAIWLRPAARADREFEQTVADWTRTSGSALISPTDKLLQVPGSEYLRSTPRVGNTDNDRSTS